ncbi:MAG: MBL fold metallo-hydrolase [Chloroflexi bacterium]|nr:MBL fold metallo-hydrolase [Chloroflexota bacterium]
MASPHTHRLGNLDLHILSDGTYYQDAGAVFGVVPRVMWERVVKPELDDQYRLPIGLNSLLVRSEGKLILVETGVGDKEGHRRQASPIEQGDLISALAALDVQPGEIDIVINSHLHADHCGWNTRAGAGKEPVPTFPKARYLIQRGEWEAATNPNERTRATYFQENFRPLEESGQLELVDGELAVTSEITMIATKGHTEDHASIVLMSGGETAIYIGDIVQHHVQLERTAWVSSFDLLPLVSMETKKRIVERAIDDQALIISVHAPFPGLGRMTRSEDGRKHWEAVE